MNQTEELISIGYLREIYFRLFLLARSELHGFNFSCSKPLFQYQDYK
jgi:hypothetical protein